MQYRELTTQQYEARLRLVIVGAEGLHARSQDVGDGKATIGWGYTFNRNNNVAIWKEARIELDERQWSVLRAIDTAPKEHKTRLGLAFDRQLGSAEADSLLRASMADYERPAERLKMPLSDERVALTSVAYNRGPGALLGSSRRPEHPVMAAIREGDRAEAWYQLRYNCWGTRSEDEGGLRKRRFAEAQVFGLYDDPLRVSADEAHSVLAMFNRNRAVIDRVEARFGAPLGAPPARPDRIAQANRDYPELTALYGRVPTLGAALEPARRALGLVMPESQHTLPLALDHATNRVAAPAHGTAGSMRSEASDVEAVHPLMRQAREAVRRLDESLGRTHDEASARMAASLAHLAAGHGFDRIDHVVLSNATRTVQKGENVFIVQGGITDATRRIAFMKTHDAVEAPVEQSLERISQLAAEQALQRSTPKPEVQVIQTVPRMVMS